MERLKTFDSYVHQDLAEPKSPSVAAVTSEQRFENNLNVRDDDSQGSPKKPKKKHIQRLVDSDSDQEATINNYEGNEEETFLNSGSESDTNVSKKNAPHRRIQFNNDSDSDTSENRSVKNLGLDSNVYQDLSEPKSPHVVADSSEKTAENNLNANNNNGEASPKKTRQKHIQRLVDSDSDQEITINNYEGNEEETFPNSGSESDTNISKSDTNVSKNNAPHRRIQLNNDSDSDTSGNLVFKNTEQQLRLKNKNGKMRNNKFKSLLLSRSKGLSTNENKNVSDERGKDSSNESADEETLDASLEEIKKKIKERMSSFKSSICDPDTSDEDTQQQKKVYKQKKERKSTKITSKPQRMTAKQAMENMHKIKSESNRMLREKDVSLPYHRPKALSLKDIMSRRQPALSSDGKSLPIKMNEKQLQQYAQMLEERQKKMSELWQSESDDDDKGCDEIVKTDTDSKQPLTNDNSEQNITDTIPASNINSQQPEKNKINENSEVPVSTEVEMDFIPNIDQENDGPQTNAPEEQDSETNINLKYIDSETSITEENINKSADKKSELITTEMTNNDSLVNNRECLTVTDPVIPDIALPDINTEDRDTENIHLHFDSEMTATELDPAIEQTDTSRKSTTECDSSTEPTHYVSENTTNVMETEQTNEKKDNSGNGDEAMNIDHFSDDELNMDDIDNIIENAEIMRDIEDKVNSPLLLRDIPLNVKPKLMGAPGMVIDLDGANPLKPKKFGVELLKERFTFFAKLKTPEEMEREKEKKLKPGTQHLKLKQELGEKIAEQRSLEWAKRLEEEKQQHNELKALRGEESDDENDIDKIEAKLEDCENQEEDNKPEEEDVEEEEELIEDDCEIKDKPRRKNGMLDDEAEVSDCDEYENRDDNEAENNESEANEDLGNEEDNAESDSDSDESESSESEEEVEQGKTKKGRILKAFEDSDDEDVNNKVEAAGNVENDKVVKEPTVSAVVGSQAISQDDELQLAQRQTVSDDLFTSQESSLVVSQTNDKIDETVQSATDMDLGTQTFSILESSKQGDAESRDLSNYDTQAGADELLDIALPNSFIQNMIPVPTQTDTSQSQPIGEDILALCTGKFYDNQFISQSEINNDPQPSQDYDNFVCDSLTSTEKSQDIVPTLSDVQSTVVEIHKNNTEQINSEDVQKKDNIANVVDDNLKSILDELADPEFDSPKPNKFFCGNKNKDSVPDSQVKKKFVIESDDENNEISEKKRKKLKKKKLEQRALHFSDDDEDEEIEQGDECNESDIEIQEDPERLVEYDSEENEIEIKPDQPKMKRKVADFFEDEAELTSEDEWVGSGDENEAGLDRMEREEGDEEVFHQGKLQRELGQIHMRDVLDQDKREVRMIQELLFEDGDLGGGGRQRKFRWKNLDGEEETGTSVDDLVESQEDQESEEQWRKQRHEREMFLRQMQGKEENESLNISVNISTKMMSTFEEKLIEKTETPSVTEKKTVKDIPSPKKPFILLQQKYGGSLLSRGHGTLARLAALAAPLAVDDDGHKPQATSRRNFVFAAISQDDAPKVTIKRKADSNPCTPKLIKKMKTEEKKNSSKSSLLDHFKL